MHIRSVTLIGRFSKNIADHLKPEDVSGAIKDILGTPVAKPRGGHYQHLNEVRNGLNGLNNAIDQMKSVLQRNDLATRQRAALSEALKKTMAHRDRIEKALSKAKQEKAQRDAAAAAANNQGSKKP